jgi:hypothetical protein
VGVYFPKSDEQADDGKKFKRSKVKVEEKKTKYGNDWMGLLVKYLVRKRTVSYGTFLNEKSSIGKGDYFGLSELYQKKKRCFFKDK